MMNSQQPRFQISKDSVNMRGQLPGSLRRPLDLPHVMIPIQCQGRVPSPTIAPDRAFPGYILIQEHLDLLLAGGASLLKPQPSCTLNRFSQLAGHGPNLHCADHQGRMGRLRYSSPSVTFSRPTDMRFIGLDHTRKKISIFPYHSLAKAMQKKPRRIVLGDSQLPLQLDCTDSRSMGCNPVRCPEPQPHGQMRIVHQAPGQRRGLPMTRLALKPPMFRQPPSTRCFADRTNKPLRPSVLDQILQANLVIVESSRKLQKIPRVSWLGHAAKLPSPHTLVKWVSTFNY